jgi:microcin C transport system permease protein
MCSELIANDKPLLVHFNDRWYVPCSPTTVKATLAARLRHRRSIRIRGFANRLSNTAGRSGRRYALAQTALTLPPSPFPSPPSTQNWLGTDANGGDVLARILYGTRISILFGLMLTLFSSVMGVVAGPFRVTTAEKLTSGASVSLKSGQVCQRCF